MEDIKPIDNDSGVSRTIYNAAPFSLQSICSKVILLQENDSNKEENIYNKLNEDMNPANTNILSSILGSDLDENLNFGPVMINTDFLTENLNLDINTEDWMNMKEFDNLIHELKVVDPSSLLNEFSQFAESDTGHENDFKELINADIGNLSMVQVDGAQTKAKTFQDDFIAYTCANLANDRLKENNHLTNKIETADKDIIIISSSDDSDFELSLPDDIDTISLSSIETFKNSIENDIKSKVTIEISPRIEYVTNFINEKADKKETKEELGAISLSSSSINFITDTKEDQKVKDLDDSYCSGYNSSDFEFITEEEAKTDGLIINYEETKRISNNETCRTVEVTAYDAPECSEMPSASNTEDYRQNHQIPIGEDYFDLFRGMYAPTVPWMYENKSMGLLMNEYAGLGFDIEVLSRQIREYQPDDEYKEEADECAKRILKMYPSENRKRRRRFY